MKNFVLPLVLLMIIAGVFAGCDSKPDVVSSGSVQEASSQVESTPAETSATPSSEAASSASAGTASVPRTVEEIVAYNGKLTAEEVALIQFEPVAEGQPTALLETSLGTIKLALYPQEAPRAVENFIALAQEGFYNDKVFYGARPNERIFSGAADNVGYEGKSASGGQFADEYSAKLWHFNGALCMNNAMIKGNNDSRFYIVQNTKVDETLLPKMADYGYPQSVIDQYIKTGGLPGADARDTVFGQVIEGMDVLEKLVNATEEVKILTVTVENA